MKNMSKHEEREKEWRQALRIWKKQNPGKGVNDIPYKGVVVKIYEGTSKEKVVNLSTRITNMKQILKGNISAIFTEDDINFWVKQEGLSAENRVKENRTPTIRHNKKRTKKERIMSNLAKEFNLDKDEVDFYFGMMSNHEKNYDYNKINLMIKLNNIYKYDNIEDFIKKVRQLYSKKDENYKSLLEMILVLLGLNANNILKQINEEDLNLERAISTEVFKTNVKYEYNYLKYVYNILIQRISATKNKSENSIVKYFGGIVREYSLEKGECQELKKLLYKYLETMKQYLITDTAFIEDEDEKIEQIKRCKLDMYDIEESCLIELNFWNGIFLETKSNIYLRRQIIKGYIIDWNYYTEVEKKRIIEENKFTLEEVEYIERKRGEIDSMIDAIKPRSNKYKKSYKF